MLDASDNNIYTSSLQTRICKCEREGAFITLDALANNISSLKTESVIV